MATVSKMIYISAKYISEIFNKFRLGLSLPISHVVLI